MSNKIRGLIKINNFKAPEQHRLLYCLKVQFKDNLRTISTKVHNSLLIKLKNQK